MKLDSECQTLYKNLTLKITQETPYQRDMGKKRVDKGLSPDPNSHTEDQYVQTTVRADQLDFFIKSLKDEQDRLLHRIEKLKERHDMLADGETVDDDPLDQKISTNDMFDRLKKSLAKNLMNQLTDATVGVQVLEEGLPAPNSQPGLGNSSPKRTVYKSSPNKRVDNVDDFESENRS